VGGQRNNRKAKFYQLTAKGRKHLTAEASRWRHMTRAIGLILGDRPISQEGSIMSLRRFVQREKKDADLAEEIESHLAHEQDANIARGLSLEEARRQARLKFGNPQATRERWGAIVPCPGSKTRGGIFACAALARQNARLHRHRHHRDRRRHSANAGVFSVINTVLLKPLSYPDPNRSCK